MSIGRYFIMFGVVFCLAACGDDISTSVTSGDVEELKKLFSEGVDPNATFMFSHPDFAGGKLVEESALVAAAVYGHAVVVELLLEAGASVKSIGGGFAICPAVAFGHTDIVSTLIRAGVDVNPTSKCGRNRNVSPLQFAVSNGDKKIVKLLVAAGATN